MAESRFTQRLAAILAADVAGYSSLMQNDEHATVATLDDCRLVFHQYVEANQGRVVDTAGDSVLAVFETAIGAAQAANEIQKVLTDRNAGLAEDRRMQFRMGVHLGDIIEKPDGTIYGDGVNIAARLQSLAAPGGIIVSEDIHHQVRHKINASFDDIGRHDVKNIADPVLAYRLATKADPDWPLTGYLKRRASAWIAATVVLVGVFVGIVTWQAGWLTRPSLIEIITPGPDLPSGPSIAVLPFVNLSGDSDQDYFAAGLTRDVIGALGRFSDLHVMSDNATARFAETTLSPIEIGRELGVQFLLGGGVRRADGQIRVDVNLTDAVSGAHLWAHRYDRAIEDLFAVQDDITRVVAGRTAARLRQEELTRLTHPVVAYDYVLRARELSLNVNRQDVFEARELYRRALEHDPNYADAYAGLAYNHFLSVSLGYTEFIVKGLERVRAYVDEALALDPDNVEARLTSALYYRQTRQYDLAANELKYALTINPSDALVHLNFGSIAVFAGHAGSAIDWFNSARTLDPRMPGWGWGELALAYYLEQRYPEAVEASMEGLKRDPSFFLTRLSLAAAYGQMGRLDEAADIVTQLHQQHPMTCVEQFAVQLGSADDAELMSDGLRKAGVRGCRSDE